MSLLNYLQFQPIDPDSDKDEINEDHQFHQEIDLRYDIDESDLEDFWNKVVNDIHNDPEWFNFSDE